MQEFVQSYKDTQAKLKDCPPEVSLTSSVLITTIRGPFV